MSGQSSVTPAAISPAPRRLHDADLVYLYDGSFEGFLCCVFESFLQHEIPFAIWTPERETATLYPIREIATDHARAQRVFASFGKNWGPKRNPSSPGISSPGGRTKSCCSCAFCILLSRWGRALSSGWATRTWPRSTR